MTSAVEISVQTDIQDNNDDLLSKQCASQQTDLCGDNFIVAEVSALPLCDFESELPEVTEDRFIPLGMVNSVSSFKYAQLYDNI